MGVDEFGGDRVPLVVVLVGPPRCQVIVGRASALSFESVFYTLIIDSQ